MDQSALHTVRNLHFLSKNSTLISRENCRFFWLKNSWKCCGFGLFSCWQLWFHEKNCQKKFWLKNSWKCWIFGQKFDFSNCVAITRKNSWNCKLTVRSKFSWWLKSPRLRSGLQGCMIHNFFSFGTKRSIFTPFINHFTNPAWKNVQKWNSEKNSWNCHVI